MKAATAIVAVALLALVPTGSALAQDSPIQFLENLMRPPVKAVTNAFRQPTRPAKPQAPVEADANTDLLSVPMPRLRPDDAPADEPDAALSYAPATTIEPVPLVPKPLIRPDLPPVARAEPSEPLKKPPPAASSTCGAIIARLGVEATPLAPVEEGACGIPAPVAVESLGGGTLDFSAKAILDCSLAETLARWTDETVQPIALRTLGKKVSGYRIAASYACRNRDGLPNTKLSEHAKGNAVDISAFQVDGEWIEVGPGWNGGGNRAEFLKAVRTAACGPFTTVLGPGSDSFHTDHFHLDRAKRRTAGPSKGLYCH